MIPISILNNGTLNTQLAVFMGTLEHAYQYGYSEWTHFNKCINYYSEVDVTAATQLPCLLMSMFQNVLSWTNTPQTNSNHQLHVLLLLS